MLPVEIYLAMLLAQCVVAAITIYLTSYFQEKGRNRASKEDIAKITGLVEDVKHSFNTQTEQLKAQLQLYNNIVTGVATEERNAIVEFNVKHSLWLFTLRDFTLGGADKTDNSEILKFKQILGQREDEFIEAQALFNLFISDSKLVDLVLKLVSLTTGYAYAYQYNYLYKLEMANKNDEGRSRNELEELRRYHLQFYSNESAKSYELIAPVIAEFRTLCREHINRKIEPGS